MQSGFQSGQDARVMRAHRDMYILSERKKTKTTTYKSKDFPEVITLILPKFMESPAHIVIRIPEDDFSETKFWHAGTAY